MVSNQMSLPPKENPSIIPDMIVHNADSPANTESRERDV